ncbi:MAG TPA: AMP-binding protein [Actinomycetes bacterium]|nr:AMP-binding protein [Actinomycetes bacterium]
MADLLAVMLPRPAAAAEIVRAWEAGDAVLPLDPAAPGPALRGILDALRPTRLLDGDGLATLPDGEPVEDGVAAVVATSGTTGAPKGVELSAEGIEASARAVSAALGAGRGDRWLACVGLHSVAGLAIVARAWHAGLPLEVHERFEVDAVAAAATAGATLVSVVPTMLARLLDAGAGLERFRRVLLGGAPAPADLVERAVDRGVPLVRTYGLTETFGGVVHDGHPLDGVELAIAADGEITLRGPMVLRRYRRDPAATRSALRDGWLHTADLGRIGSDGRLRVLGRRDDLVITGGVSVQPAEVEAVLAGHPAVADVAVGPAPDPEWGQRLVAYVVPVDRLLPPRLADLRAFAQERLTAAKAPRELVLMDALPRTASGKILRRRLRCPTPAGPSPAASDDAVIEGA